MTANNERPEVFLKPHKQLRGKPEGETDAWCVGNDNQYAIKDKLYLGYVYHTDVFELYLKHPQEQAFLNYANDDSKKIAWTLAVVLRQALADSLGINADELGYTVKPTKLPLCSYPVATIALYDTASGGAGFASSAHRDFAGLSQAAKKYLDCTCQSVCQNCLLGFDTRFHIDQLDRHLALGFLTDDFIRALALPDELKLLGANSRWTPESLFTEIRQAADQGASELRLLLHGDAAAWEILGSLGDGLYRWKSLYAVVTLLINTVQERQLADIAKEDLWVLHRLGIKTAVLAERPKLDNIGTVLAQTLSPQRSTTFACSKATTMIPDENWLNDGENVLIVANDYPPVPVSRNLDSAQLKPQAGLGDVEIEILGECNGRLADFGRKFWEFISAQHQPLQQHLNNGELLTRISYSDRYLYSPWTLLLIAELIDGLRQTLQSGWNKPDIDIHTAPKRTDGMYQKKGLFADWLDDDLRLAVMEAYFTDMDENCTADASEHTAHGRFLKLHWQSGTTTTLRFDQGVSYWACANTPYFDNTLSANEQAKTLLVAIPSLTVKNHKDFPTQIFIKSR